MPSPQTTVLDAEQRSWSYWFVDGLPNLIGGLACCCIACALFLARQLSHRPLVIAAVIISLLLYGVILFRMRQTIEWLKARVTYPRTGYTASPYFTDDTTLPVELTTLALNEREVRNSAEIARRYEDRNRRFGFVVGVLAAALAFVWFVHSNWICLVAGAILGAATWFATRENGRTSWIEVAGFPFVGYMMMIVRTGLEERLGAFLLGSGLVLMLSGALLFFQYLRRNPAARA
jgi:hypothetical protein